MDGQGQTGDIAVIGAAGETGQVVIAALRRRSATIRALMRRDGQQALFGDGVSHRVIELADPASLAAGLRGVAVAYYIPPVFNTEEERFGDNVIAAAEEAGIERLVYHSVLHAPTPDMPHHARKARVELALRHSNVAWTIVQPAMYVNTPLTFLDRQKGRLAPGFDVDRPFNPIALDDLAEAVATILTEDRHAYATYELAGTQRLTFRDMAAHLSAVHGTTISAVEMDPDLVVDQAVSRGFSGAAAEEIRSMMAYYHRYGLVGNGNVLEMILGRPSLSFGEAVSHLHGG